MERSLSGPLILALDALYRRRDGWAAALWRENSDRAVRWIEGAQPQDEEAAAVSCAVLRCELTTYGAIVDHVTDHLFRRDSERAGWLGDIGLFRSWYRTHACQLLERLDGSLVRIERS